MLIFRVQETMYSQYFCHLENLNAGLYVMSCLLNLKLL